MKKVLITGAGGFVGQWLVRELLGRSNIVLTPKMDINNYSQVTEVLKKEKPNCIVHLAALSTVGEAKANRQLAWQTNFNSTVNLAETILKETPRTTLIAVGSSDAYGLASSENTLESSLFEPATLYGATKGCADIALGQMQKETDLKLVRFRPFNHTGPGQAESFVISSFTKQMVEISLGLKEPVMHVGNLSAFRDFSDVRDITRAYGIAVDQIEFHNEAMNLCSEKSIQIQQIIDILAELLGITVEIQVDPNRYREESIAKIQGNADIARNILGWNSKYTLEETLMDMIHYWKNYLTN